MNSPVSNILVFVDGTEQSVTAAQYGICLAKSLKVKLYVLYVVNTRALQDLVKTRIFVKAEQEEYEKDLEADAERSMPKFEMLSNRIKSICSSSGNFPRSEAGGTSSTMRVKGP